MPVPASTADHIGTVYGFSQNWLDKPDGNEGWASLFLRQGCEVYIVDQVGRGRSPASSEKAGDTKGTRRWTVEYCERMFTASKDHCLWPQAAKHTRWPGTGRRGDPAFDAFYRACVPSVTDNAWQQKVMQVADVLLLDEIGKPLILIGHSQGGVYPLLIADARPHPARAIGAPGASWSAFHRAILFQGNSTVRPESPSPRKLVDIAPIPILFMQAEASYHASYDLCTVDYLRQAGCDKLDYMDLADMGAHGNGHVFILEENSSELQVLLDKWLQGV